LPFLLQLLLLLLRMTAAVHTPRTCSGPRCVQFCAHTACPPQPEAAAAAAAAGTDQHKLGFTPLYVALVTDSLCIKL
jgi:hypothetical protein